MLEKNGVSNTLISFDISFTNIFLEFTSPNQENFVKVKNDLIDLSEKYDTIYTIRLCGFRAFDQQLPIPNDAIPLKQLDPSTHLPPIQLGTFFAVKSNLPTTSPQAHDATLAFTEQLNEVNIVLRQLRQNESVWRLVRENPTLLIQAAADLSSKHSPLIRPASSSSLESSIDAGASPADASSRKLTPYNSY